MARTKTPLEIIESPTEFDAVFDLGVGNPYASISGLVPDEDLVCGRCGDVLMPEWSRDRVYRVLSSRNPVVLTCPTCRTLNRLPVQVRLDE
jgi:hypothetical protein